MSDELTERIKSNLDALDACSGPHDFRDCTPNKRMGKHYECSKCGGMVDWMAHKWYTKGLEHGAGK